MTRETNLDNFMTANKESGVVTYETNDDGAQYTLADGRVFTLTMQDSRSIIPRWDFTT